MSWIKRWFCKNDRVEHQSTSQNIYHCTVQKSASQWVRGILSDPRTFRFCGLRSYQHEQQLPGGIDPRKLTERSYPKAFPDRTIATPLYLPYEGFAAIPKPARYKAFFVMRDPRDVLVSWYFSVKCSHPALGEIERLRRDLSSLPEPEGLRYALEFLHDFGLFQAQRSWAGAAAKDPNVLLIRYEDMIGPRQLSAFEQLLAHCDIRLPRADLQELLRLHSFEELSGRPRGQEDIAAHYRKGVAGDWRNHFRSTALQERFTELAGDVLDVWGYE